MAFGSSGFGGFGQNNNTANQTSAFGAFGGGANAGTTAFGSTGGAFGNNNGGTGTGIFGGGNNSGGGFGSTGTSGFGAAKPAFGAPATTGNTGLFGGTAGGNTASTSSGFGSGGGFGSAFGQPNTSNNNTGFGSSGLFGSGANKTAFGAPATNAMFGGSGTVGGSTGAFGTTGFGSGNPGLGTNIGDPPGTASVQFQATIEKEANNPSMSNAFQNILFMDTYKKWSSEELRLADYNSGRRHGNASGTGAFGQSTFGGFTNNAQTTQTGGAFGGGNSNAMFGAQSNTAGNGAFGQVQTNTGFGNPTAGGGGLFGNKSGGLFGNSSPARPANSIFGAGNNQQPTTGFGATSNNNTGAFGTGTTAGAGSGLFGAKPAGSPFGGGGLTGGAQNTGGLFGNNAGATSAFGQNNANSGGLFGTSNQPSVGGGMFGGQQANSNTAFGGSAFGNAQNSNSGLFGANSNQQQKPATGLFGSAPTATATGAGLFGGAATNSTPFGANNNQTGLFGAKPAAAGTGLFGSAQPAQSGNAGTGMFGGTALNNQTQQTNTSGGLFGPMMQNTNQAKPLFGGAQGGGGGLFGTPNNQQQSGLFGTSGSQQQGSTMGTSLFNNNSSLQGTPQSFANIDDVSAYGASSLFSNVPESQMQNPGPLATPLSGQAKNKARSVLPLYKLSPANQFVTPQRRGYGFSYSTYGSPSSPSSVSSTPGGLGRSLLSSSINRGLSKSTSTSSLRRSLNADDSIFAPGAFSASTNSRLLPGGGSHKKLVINRDLRSGDLFSSPSKDRTNTPTDVSKNPRRLSKRVSFDDEPVAAIENGPSTSGTASTEPFPNGAENQKSPERLQQQRGNGDNGVNRAADKSSNTVTQMEQVKGKELPVVHEEEVAVTGPKSTTGIDKTPGSYWMQPPKEVIEGMNRMQRQKVANFTVGRENVGSVSFKVPVDLSNIDLDHLFEEIIILQPRSATVYPNPAKKPTMGKGLNVPAVISLEQSWPRGKGNVRVAKHVERLKRITDTTFESYDVDSGVWVFSVEHFTTYGDDQDDEDDGADTSVCGSEASKAGSHDPAIEQDVADMETPQKSAMRLPPYTRELMSLSESNMKQFPTDSWRGPADSSPRPDAAPTQSADDLMLPDGLASWYPAQPAEDFYRQNEVQTPRQSHGSQGQEEQERMLGSPDAAGGIMRARMRALRKSTAPEIEVVGDWAQTLQQSVRKPRVDRETLRALNESGAANTPKEAKVQEVASFATSIDVMKSLFEPQLTQVSPAAMGLVKWPVASQDKSDTAPRPGPRWGPGGKLVTVNGISTTLHSTDTWISDDSQGPAGPEKMETLWDLMARGSHSGFCKFWQQLLSDASEHSMDQVCTAEQKVIEALCGGRIDEACQILQSMADFRLSSLVSTIGLQKEDIRLQMQEWKQTTAWSEFSQSLQTIYEVLGGNPCASPLGGLDWKQAFGLRLFCTDETSVEGAVRAFQADIEEGKEQAPVHDALWTLLKIYAYRLFPWEAADLLGWNLTAKIWEQRKEVGIDFGLQAEANWDRCCLSFASSFTAKGQWLLAYEVLSSLQDMRARMMALQDHLCRYIHLLRDKKDTSGVFFEAKALYFRYRRNTRGETDALIQAKNFPEACRVFEERLAPELIIRREYDTLVEMTHLLRKVRRNWKADFFGGPGHVSLEKLDAWVISKQL